MILLPLLLATGYMHMADVNKAVDRYAQREAASLDASSYVLSPCRRIHNKTARCTVTFTDVTYGGGVWDWDEYVDVRQVGRRIRVTSVLFD